MDIFEGFFLVASVFAFLFSLILTEPIRHAARLSWEEVVAELDLDRAGAEVLWFLGLRHGKHVRRQIRGCATEAKRKRDRCAHCMTDPFEPDWLELQKPGVRKVQ